MKKIVAVMSVILVASFALSQDQDGGEIKRKQTRDVKVTKAPVTRAEAKKTFDKAWNAVSKALKLKSANPIKMVSDGKSVTKDEVLSSMKSIVTLASVSFKRSASPVKFDQTRFRQGFNSAEFSKLVKDGFVMPVGPLVTGDKGSLSTYEFGDAIGVMLVRIADLAHLPPRKFTPDLMGG